MEGNRNAALTSVFFVLEPGDELDESDFKGLSIVRDGGAFAGAALDFDSPEAARLEESSTVWRVPLTSEIRDAGAYRIEGEYKGIPFSSMRYVIEEPLEDLPADLGDWRHFYMANVYYDGENLLPGIDEATVVFNGRQQSMSLSGFAELKLSRDGASEPIGLAAIERSFGYAVEVRSDGPVEQDEPYTQFFVKLDRVLTEPGEYVLEGSYMGKKFLARSTVAPL
jgi:hypothetical protein